MGRADLGGGGGGGREGVGSAWPSGKALGLFCMG